MNTLAWAALLANGILGALNVMLATSVGWNVWAAIGAAGLFNLLVALWIGVAGQAS